MADLGLFALDFGSTMGIKSRRVFRGVRGKGKVVMVDVEKLQGGNIEVGSFVS